MPIVGIIADSSLEDLQGSSAYGVFACMISETVRREFGYDWNQVVLMSFSLEDFGRRLMRASQYCAVANRPRWWLRGDAKNIQDMILCDNLIYLTPCHHSDAESQLFLQFTRRKKRILWDQRQPQ